MTGGKSERRMGSLFLGTSGSRQVNRTQLFTTVGAGTWTVPQGVSSVEVELVGGGGGGGGDFGGGGGGGGGTTFGTKRAGGGGGGASGGTTNSTRARGGSGGGGDGGYDSPSRTAATAGTGSGGGGGANPTTARRWRPLGWWCRRRCNFQRRLRRRARWRGGQHKRWDWRDR